MLRELRKNKGLGTPANCLLEEAGLWDLAEERGDEARDGERAQRAAVS